MSTPSNPTAPARKRAKKKATKKKVAKKKLTKKAASSAKKPSPAKPRKPLPRPRHNAGPDDPWCGLSIEHVEICEAYLADRERNQTSAWRLHFAQESNENSARASASRFFASKAARKYLARRRAEIAAHLAVTPEKVLEELAALAFSDPGEVMEWGPDGVTFKDSRFLPRHARAAVQSVKRTTRADGGSSMHITLADKRAALDLLGRSLDLWRGGEGDTGPALMVVMPG